MILRRCSTSPTKLRAIELIGLSQRCLKCDEGLDEFVPVSCRYRSVIRYNNGSPPEAQPCAYGVIDGGTLTNEQL